MDGSSNRLIFSTVDFPLNGNSSQIESFGFQLTDYWVKRILALAEKVKTLDVDSIIERCDEGVWSTLEFPDGDPEVQLLSLLTAAGEGEINEALDANGQICSVLRHNQESVTAGCLIVTKDTFYFSCESNKAGYGNKIRSEEFELSSLLPDRAISPRPSL